MEVTYRWPPWLTGSYHPRFYGIPAKPPLPAEVRDLSRRNRAASCPLARADDAVDDFMALSSQLVQSATLHAMTLGPAVMANSDSELAARVQQAEQKATVAARHSYRDVAQHIQASRGP